MHCNSGKTRTKTLTPFFRPGILLALLLLAAPAAQTALCAAEPARTLSNAPARAEALLLDNGIAKVGIDRAKGTAITWLSWTDYPKNMVNSADPVRLIQQSYYAGKCLVRKADGQSSKSWSP
jgi:hypothetical protein